MTVSDDRGVRLEGRGKRCEDGGWRVGIVRHVVSREEPAWLEGTTAAHLGGRLRARR